MENFSADTIVQFCSQFSAGFILVGVIAGFLLGIIFACTLYSLGCTVLDWKQARKELKNKEKEV